MPLPNIPVPQPVLQRFWDFVVQGIANLAKDRDRDDIARRIEQLRATPNPDRLVSDSVDQGWHDWLRESKWPQLTAAILAAVNTYFPTIYRKGAGGALAHPNRRSDVEADIAEWFYQLNSGLARRQCERAAQELTEYIVRAALDKGPLHDLVSNILQWDNSQHVPTPGLSRRVLQTQAGARAAAEHDHYPLITSAHLLYALSSLTPAYDPQAALHGKGATPDQIRAKIAQIPFDELPAGSTSQPAAPKQSAGVYTILRETVALATEDRAAAADDSHLLRACLVLAADPRCEAGASLRYLFSLLGISPTEWANALSVQHAWPSISASPGVTLSLFGI